MKERFSDFRLRWKQINRVKKIISFLALIVAVCILIFMCVDTYNTWKENKYAAVAFGILMAYLFPVLYTFYREIKSKNKEILEIVKIGQKEIIEDKLMVFDYYTLPHFMADIFKQFSSLWVFVFLQTILMQIPEFSDPKAEATLEVYIGFIIMALMVCLSVYFTVAGCTLAISTESLTRKRHVKYIMKVKKIL